MSPSPADGRSRDILDRLTTAHARAIMLLIVAIWAAGAILVYAQPVLAPVLFALVVGVVISPLADRLAAAGVPRFVLATALMILTSGILFLAFVALEPLLSALARRLPEIRIEIEGWIQTAAGLLRGLEDISEEIERAVGENGETTETEVPELPTVFDAIWLAPNLGASVLLFAGTLFFFVLNRPEIYAAAGEREAQLYRADRAVSRYFAAVTIVNIGLGAATATVLSLIGLDSAIMWGLAAALANFVLYIGPLTIIISLFIAGVVQFSGPLILAPPLAFMALNMVEAQLVTPAVVGQRLKMAPLAVFLAIMFGLWLWGPVGAIVALPVTLWLGVLIEGRRSSRAAAAAEARAAAGANESPAG